MLILNYYGVQCILTTLLSKIKIMSDFFIALHPEDIIYSLIFTHLSIKDCFNLRCMSHAYKNLVDNYFQQLKHLNLSHYNFFPDKAFKVFVSNCSYLDTIQLSSCTWLTNDLLIPLFKNNLNITNLDLSYCPKLTSACLQPIIIFCKNLKTLNLGGSLWLTYGCLEALIFHHTNLCYLSLSNCSQISDRNIIYSLLSKFPKLHTLDVSNTSLIDAKFAEFIYEMYPQVQLIILDKSCIFVKKKK